MIGDAVSIIRAIILELELVGSFHLKHESDDLLAALADGSLYVEPVVSREFPSMQAIEAFDCAKDPTKSGKVLILFRTTNIPVQPQEHLMTRTFRSPALRCRPTRSVTAGTGTHCPANGRWSPNGEQEDSQIFFEGSVMPPFKGARVVWVLGPDPDRH